MRATAPLGAVVLIAMLVACSSGSANGVSIISRMLSRVWPSTLRSYIDGVDIDPLEAAASTTVTATDDAESPSSANDRTASTATPHEGWNTIGAADTAGWNPFTWFSQKLRSIPYNPDSDLQTVRFGICV